MDIFQFNETNHTNSSDTLEKCHTDQRNDNVNTNNIKKLSSSNMFYEDNCYSVMNSNCPIEKHFENSNTPEINQDLCVVPSSGVDDDCRANITDTQDHISVTNKLDTLTINQNTDNFIDMTQTKCTIKKKQENIHLDLLYECNNTPHILSPLTFNTSGNTVVSESETTQLNKVDTPTLWGTVIFVGNNQDQSFISMGTAEGGFYIFSSQSGQCIYNQQECGGPVIIIEMLLCSSIVAIVVASTVSDENDDIISVDTNDRLFNQSSITQSNHTVESSTPQTAPITTQQKRLLSDIGCHAIQLWSLQTSLRIAIVSFPSHHPSASFLCPKVSFETSHHTTEPAQSHYHCEYLKDPNEEMTTRIQPTIVAVKLSHRRMVVLLDCPYPEIEIFDLRTLRLIHRLERNLVIVPNVLHSQQGYVDPRLSYFKTSAFNGTNPSNSLASVGCLAIHPCQGFLAVPVVVAAVNVNSKIALSPLKYIIPSERLCSHPIADEHFVSAAAEQGAFINHEDIGSIILIDLHGPTAKIVNSEKAHDHPIGAITFNASATMLATASIKGTIFRVWAVPSLEQLWCWRRGSRPARIQSLNFTWNSYYLISVTEPRDNDCYLFSTGRNIGSSGLYTHTSFASYSGHIPMLMNKHTSDSIISVQIFLCTKRLTSLQKKKHLPPTFWDKSNCSTIHQTPLSFPNLETASKKECHLNETDFSNEWTLSRRHSHRIKKSFSREDMTSWTNDVVILGENDNQIEEFQRYGRCMIEHVTQARGMLNNLVRMISDTNPNLTLNNNSNHKHIPITFSPTEHWQALKSSTKSFNHLKANTSAWANWLSMTAKTQLKNVLSGVVIPSLPDAVREAWFDPQTCFIKLKVKSAPPVSGNSFRVVNSVATVFEDPRQKFLEVRVFSQTGCVLSYTCDATVGGEARLKFEKALLYSL